MQIASWNVNSVKARMHAVTAWLKSASPDVACLQEIKTVDEAFPFMEIEALGYNVEVQFEEVTRRLDPLNDGDALDEQARYIEAVISGPNGPFRVASIYLPNGNPTHDGENIHPKYAYKLAWMERLARRAASLLPYEEPLILAGDYNVIPEDKDTHDPIGWRGDAAFRPETHAAFQRLLNLGLTEAFEQMDGRAGQYTFWDYQRGAWQNNNGIRIDHLLLSPQAADKITALRIDKIVRDGEKPSDHVPIIGTFDL